eukprot:TRINITY_DN10427_c0_g1_i2.p1 TRINITY_DN10427_c0_g1~~TRINITY_DN10427_c0_g1_i2.p1  ORF type:complete len:872 (+),score=224.55 TRINITY_DN10427_c0_g1_i2:175-2790(+)
MSRICVKNLPRYLDVDRFREHFSQTGEVTDAKIMKTKDGRSRQFGFIGYRTEEEAIAAVAYKVGAPDIPRPWSRYSQKKEKEAEKPSKANAATHLESDKEGSLKENPVNLSTKEGDPLFQEFLQVMQPRSKTKVWANDTVLGPNSGPQGVRNKHSSAQRQGKKGKKKVDVETVDGILRKVPVGKGKSSEKLHRVHVRFEDESEEDSEGDESENNENILLEPPAEAPANDEGNKMADTAKDDAVSDMDYFKSRVKSSWDSDDENDQDGSPSEASDRASELEEDSGEENSADRIEDTNAGPKVNESTDSGLTAENADNEQSTQEVNVVGEPDEEAAIDSRRLFIRNLPFTTSEEELDELFAKYGELAEVHVVLDKLTKKSKGYAYVLYKLPDSAERALEELDNSIFQGRLLHVMPAKKAPSVPEKQLDINKVPTGMNIFKHKREEQKKAAEASGDTRAWNSLFMHPDTVAENVARKFKISKSELLNPEADDLAVRMALGETHVIAETKKALSEAGVNVESLEDLASGKMENTKRSNRVLLIKNLPFSTSEYELVEMFGKFGSLERIIVPPTKTMALALYLEAAEARAAFKGLAYKRYKHVPLYLEWAPENVISSNPKASSRAAEEQPVADSSIKRVTSNQHNIMSEDVDSDNEEVSASVFVKNLNFKTTAAALKKHFEEKMKDGVLRSIALKSGDRPGRENRGFCFLEFDSVETAKIACKSLQGTVLDGHALSLQMSYSRKAHEAQGKKLDKRKSLTKIIVKNLAFEATKKDLRQLFGPFGQIKSLRIPKKADRNHRGFAFIEFVTKQEAENAFKALSNSHLYGRHLVLEQAQENESLSDLRAKIASKFVDDNDPALQTKKPLKKRKIMQSLE